MKPSKLSYLIVPISALLVAAVPKSQFSPKNDLVKNKPKLTSAYLMTYNFLGKNPNFPTAIGIKSLEITSHNLNLAYRLNSKYSASILTGHQKKLFKVEVRGALHEVKTEGLTDTQIGLIHHYRLKKRGHLNFSAHLSFPTGSYKEKKKSGKLASYRGQLGSGTYDFVPGIKYRQRYSNVSFKGSLFAILRSDFNDLDYRRGNELSGSFSANYWVYKYFSIVSLSKYVRWGKVQGNRNLKDPSGLSGHRWSTNLGVKTGFFNNHTFIASLEAGFPLYSEYHGGSKSIKSKWYSVAFLNYNF